MEIVELSERKDILEEAIRYFWECWGHDNDFLFYKDFIEHSIDLQTALPRFYLAISKSQIIGTYALLTNDLVSRQDLVPWFACLFVSEPFRNQGIAGKLLAHGLQEASLKGFEQLYLCTDLDNFYEKKGWSYLSNGYNPMGGKVKIYNYKLKEKAL